MAKSSKYMGSVQSGFKRVLPFFVTTITVMMAAQSSRADSLINGSFESGSFSGWTLNIPTGNSEFNGTMPAGSATVTSCWGPNTGMSGPVVPQGGCDFALINSSEYGNFVNPRASYDITASQQITLNAGDTVSGFAFFYNGDFYNGADKAFVKILDGNADLALATPWCLSSGPSTYRTATPWTAWQWQAPTTGTYTLELGITTLGTDTLASYGGFDNIHTTPANLGITPVPEPSTIGILSLAAIGLIANRRLLKK